MALVFETSEPERLLNAFKRAIDDGRVATWSYDHEGDFTHTTAQWKNAAWLRPRPGNPLKFNIMCPKDRPISSEVYAIYHGRFIESMLAHCDSLFRNVTATALPAQGDRIKP